MIRFLHMIPMAEGIGEEMSQQASEAAQEVTAQVSEELGILHTWLEGFADNAMTMAVKIVFALVVFLVGRQLIKLLLRIFRSSIAKVGTDETVVKFLECLLKTAAYIVLGLFLLNTLGFEATSFAAIVASAGVAVGLALQGSLSDFAGGVLILLLKPFQVGDYIIEGSYEGTVKNIGLVYTELVTADNRLVFIPNGGLSTDRLINVSAMDTRRVDIPMLLSYETDLGRMRKILLDIAGQEELVLEDPPAEVVVVELGDRGVRVECRCWVKTPDYWPVRNALAEKFKNAVDSAGAAVRYTMSVDMIKELGYDEKK